MVAAIVGREAAVVEVAAAPRLWRRLTKAAARIKAVLRPAAAVLKRRTLAVEAAAVPRLWRRLPKAVVGPKAAIRPKNRLRRPATVLKLRRWLVVEAAALAVEATALHRHWRKASPIEARIAEAAVALRLQTAEIVVLGRRAAEAAEIVALRWRIVEAENLRWRVVEAAKVAVFRRRRVAEIGVAAIERVLRSAKAAALRWQVVEAVAQLRLLRWEAKALRLKSSASSRHRQLFIITRRAYIQRAHLRLLAAGLLRLLTAASIWLLQARVFVRVVFADYSKMRILLAVYVERCRFFLIYPLDRSSRRLEISDCKCESNRLHSRLTAAGDCRLRFIWRPTIKKFVCCIAKLLLRSKIFLVYSLCLFCIRSTIAILFAAFLQQPPPLHVRI